jgi:hypothetical protein
MDVSGGVLVLNLYFDDLMRGQESCLDSEKPVKAVISEWSRGLLIKI